jgi:hypothetical protein
VLLTSISQRLFGCAVCDLAVGVAAATLETTATCLLQPAPGRCAVGDQVGKPLLLVGPVLTACHVMSSHAPRQVMHHAPHFVSRFRPELSDSGGISSASGREDRRCCGAAASPCRFPARSSRAACGHTGRDAGSSATA